MPTTNDPAEQAILAALAEHGPWYVGCWWTWDGTDNTEARLDAMAARGLVVKQDGRYHLS